MSQFSHLRTHLPLAGKHVRFIYSNLFKNLHQKFVLLRLATQIRQLRRYTFFHLSSQKNLKLSMFQFKKKSSHPVHSWQTFKAKITDSDSCHVCELKQTVEHLFVECQHVHPFSNLFPLGGTMITRPQCPWPITIRFTDISLRIDPSIRLIFAWLSLVFISTPQQKKANHILS